MLLTMVATKRPGGSSLELTFRGRFRRARQVAPVQQSVAQKAVPVYAQRYLRVCVTVSADPRPNLFDFIGVLRSTKTM